MRRAGLLAALVATLAACGDISAPRRSDWYEWRLIVPAGGLALDTINFHWPESHLPVRIWVEDEYGMPAHVQRGIDQWQEAFLYGELSATVVSDSTTADVIVRTDPPPAVPTASARLGSLLAPQCSGATDIDIDQVNDLLNLPVRVYVHPRLAPEAPGFDACMALTATHELGHAFGIFRHSPEPTDIMFGDPVAEAPSERDLNTAELLYHVPNTVRAVRPD